MSLSKLYGLQDRISQLVPDSDHAGACGGSGWRSFDETEGTRT